MKQQAYQIGWNEALNGGTMIPVQSAELMELLKDVKVGGAVEIMREFQRGFLAAPVQ